MNTRTIISSHATIAEAVEASGQKYEYNPDLARQEIARIDNPSQWWKERGFKPAIEALVLDDNGTPQPYYVYEIDGIRFLGRFNPFHKVLCDSDFIVYALDKKAGKVIETGVTIKKSERKAVRAICHENQTAVIG